MGLLDPHLTCAILSETNQQANGLQKVQDSTTMPYLTVA